MMIALLLVASLTQTQDPGISGSWRAAVDQAGGPLRFSIQIETGRDGFTGRLCNGPSCDAFSAIVPAGDSILLDLADYDAAITVIQRGDSLVGYYRNVGSRGPRIIPFRAARGQWSQVPASSRLTGSWDATFHYDTRTSPRLVRLNNGPTGVEAAFITNTGDYGQFWGTATPDDSVDIGRFDGTFVYRLSGRLVGDTLRGVFHAGLSTQTPFTAVRSTGARHLTPPLEVTSADTSNPFHFAFPDLDGREVTERDPRLVGKVVMVDIFGSWCTTCHDAAPTLVKLYQEYRPRGLEMIGLAYEVTGDSAVDNRLVRRFRDKFGIEWPLLLAGLNLSEATAATLPQLKGFTAYPTTVFLGRDGRIRRVHAGFIGPAGGELHHNQVAEFRRFLDLLLAEPTP